MVIVQSIDTTQIASPSPLIRSDIVLKPGNRYRMMGIIVWQANHYIS